MKISELEDGTEVIFEVHISEKKFEFPSVLHTKKWGNAYFEPIRHNGKVLIAQNENVHINMLKPVENDKPIIWRDLDAKAMVYKRKVYYQLDAESSGKPFNRRKSYRQYVGGDVKVRVGADVEVQGVLRDVGMDGFAVICNESLEKFKNEIIHITYIYKDDTITIELDLFGKIVREQEVGNDRILYGCVLVRKNSMIDKFVHYKQKEQLIRDPRS